MKPSIIVIGGPSAAGKTTVGAQLSLHYPEEFEHIRQDDYLKNPKTFPKLGNYLLWEWPENIKFDIIRHHLTELLEGKSIDWHTFAKNELEQVFHYTLRPKRYIVLEGSLVLTQDAILEIAQRKIFLDIPYEVAKERRRLRSISQKIELGDFEKEMMFPAYGKYLYLKERAEILIDANRPEEDVIKSVEEAIRADR